MPKNKGKGGKNRRRGKNDNEAERRELTLADPKEQVYAQVLKMLGSGRVMAHCFDGRKRMCHIRGKMRKKVWVNAGDIVLVSTREFQADKGDVILKYNPDEARMLKFRGLIPEMAKINEADAGFESDDEGEIDFKEGVDLEKI
eukprot:Lankesteria_metandrocarpae@DN2034_c0_g1_i1.p2